jgi:predicted type IV restriction endonuclease
MDIKDLLKNLSDRIEKHKDQIQTEESTKNAFIMPFIQLLGYDVFNPMEVVPEYTADIGIKKGEKVDYAILKEGHPIILIECKHWAENLNVHNSQLLRYFHTSKAKFGILTNGIHYRFFTDLELPNKMDEKPFLEVNLLDLKDNQLDEVKKFHKSYFNLDSIVSTASELKYVNEIKTLLMAELNTPSEPFVRYIAKQIYAGMATAKVIDQFTPLIKKSFTQMINDLITERLKSALSKETELESKKQGVTTDNDPPAKEDKIVTTEEEIEAYLIVKSIIRPFCPPEKIHFKDAQSYCSVLYDNNVRKPICRIYLNGKRKLLGVFDNDKKETKFELVTLDIIYEHSEALISVVKTYND